MRWVQLLRTRSSVLSPESREVANKVLWRCDECGGPAKWMVQSGHAYYWCVTCSVQLEMFEGVVKTTILNGGNFSPDSEYVEREERESGPGQQDQGLPF